MKKTVLITGAYGFLGRYVAQAYKFNNFDVIGIGHGQWEKNEWHEWGIDNWCQCDVTLNNLVEYVREIPNVIVHCAGSGSVAQSVKYPMADFERTVLTMQSVAEFVRIHSPRTKIVYPSSAAVYGQVNKIPITEDSALNPISPYGFHKKMAEDICLFYAKQYDIEVAIVRLFSVYGQGLRKQLLWDACCKLDAGTTHFFGTGLEVRDWLHVTDVANLLVRASKFASSRGIIVNGGSGVGITVEHILTILFSYFKTQMKPSFIGVENVGNPDQYQADVSKIKDWNWMPEIDIEKGIRQYVDWYKKGAL